MTARTDSRKPATALPWKAWDDDGTGTLPCILGKQVNGFGNFYAAQCNMYGDAQFIAHACNAYPRLVAALRELHAIDERKLEASAKRTYAIGRSIIEARVLRNRALLAELEP